jgi:hypothetical protein
MGIFGLGKQTSNEEHTCSHCGKKIKAGDSFTKEGRKYCCVKCCGDSEKSEKKKAGTCEFC